MVVLVKDHYQFSLLGQTRDDAAGEAFDKIARALGLGYPGGPEIEKAAKMGDPKKFRFPKALRKEGFEFSFSGLKTAVIQTLHNLPPDQIPVADICAGVQKAITDILVEKAIAACEMHHCSHLVLSGGVAANGYLRAILEKACEDHQIKLKVPPLTLCTDNAAMIGCAGYYKWKMGYHSTAPFKATPTLKIENS